MEKTSKEKQKEIIDNCMKALQIPSPYSVWEPIEDYNYHLANITKVRCMNDLEASYVKGEIAKSDMFILRAIHCYGFASRNAVISLLNFWKQQEIKNANGGTMRALPSTDNLSNFWNRIRTLANKGAVYRHEFVVNPTYKSVYSEVDSREYRGILSVSSIAVSMYKTALQDNLIQFDSRLAFSSEDEIMRRIQISEIVGAFLQNSFINDVKFNVTVLCGRKRIALPAVMKASYDGKGEAACKLIFDALTIRTNTQIIKRDSREKWAVDRLREILSAMAEMDRAGSVISYVVLCLEDYTMMQAIRDVLLKEAPDKIGRFLFTTGTIIDRNGCMTNPENLGKSFLEFGKDGRLLGATGYYFLDQK